MEYLIFGGPSSGSYRFDDKVLRKMLYQGLLDKKACHDFHRFSSFSLSPRCSHSFRSTMTYFYPLPYLILSFFPLSYLLRSHDQDGKRDLIRDDCLQFRAIPKITTRTSRSMDPLSGDVPRSQELPVPLDRLHRIQLLPGKHLRRRTPQSVWRPELYRSPASEKNPDRDTGCNAVERFDHVPPRYTANAPISICSTML